MLLFGCYSVYIFDVGICDPKSHYRDFFLFREAHLNFSIF